MRDHESLRRDELALRCSSIVNVVRSPSNLRLEEDFYLGIVLPTLDTSKTLLRTVMPKITYRERRTPKSERDV